METLLSVRNLSVQFGTPYGLLRAVNGVSFDVFPRSTLGLVGESGCGKTVTCLSVLQLIDKPGQIKEGSVCFEGKDLLKMEEAQLRNIRGNKISFVFQEPMTSLNPVLTVGEQITETLLAHRKMSKRQAQEKAVDLLEKVKMPWPKKIIYQYPHNLSGGQRQRVMIAQALALGPKLLIADEPTTALDVTVQAKILELLEGLREEFNMSVLIVTHDFGIIARLADFVAVMYAGEIVEYADVRAVLKGPLHPYTKGLLNALPQSSKKFNTNRLSEIPGTLPDLTKAVRGCVFYPRCSEREDRCFEAGPFFKEVGKGHWVRCIKN